MRRTRPHTDQCTNRKKLPLDSWPQTQDYYQMYFSPIYMFILLFFVSLNVEILIFYTAFFSFTHLSDMVTGHQTKDYRITYIRVLPTETYLHRQGRRVRGSEGRGQTEGAIRPPSPPLYWVRTDTFCSAPSPHNYSCHWACLFSLFFLAKWKIVKPQKMSDHEAMKSKRNLSLCFFSLEEHTDTFTLCHTHAHTHFQALLLFLHLNVLHTLKRTKYKDPCQKE